MTHTTLSELAEGTRYELDEDAMLLERLDKTLYLANGNQDYIRQVLWCIGHDFGAITGQSLIATLDPMESKLLRPEFILRKWFAEAKRHCATDLFAKVFLSHIGEE